MSVINSSSTTPYKPEIGILYVATGQQYLLEAFRSAQISRTTTSLPIAICTDLHFDLKSSPFDFYFKHPCPKYSYRDKIPPLIDPPFLRTLYLDTDAFVIQNSSLFNAECSFTPDLCAVRAPVRIPPGWRDNSVPDFFPEVNTGVLFFKHSSITQSLFVSWLKLYDNLFDSCNQNWDQASFRSVLWSMIQSLSIDFMSVPQEFNIRTTKPWIVGRGSFAYIIHGRYPDTEHHDFIDYINGDIDTFRTSDLWLKKSPSSSIRPRFDRTYI